MRSLIRSISYFLHSDPAASRLATHRRSDMRRTAKTSSSWASAIERGDKPAYLAIADAIAADIEEGETPRRFAFGPYDLGKEVAGSVALINSLLPAGKKVAFSQWSGTTLPYLDAIAEPRAEKSPNTNDGDTRH